jgi:translation initiation factor 2 beta subunit (eIF-2beta)/eIF-5
MNGKVQMVQTSTCSAGRNSMKSINLEREGKTTIIQNTSLQLKLHDPTKSLLGHFTF